MLPDDERRDQGHENAQRQVTVARMVNERNPNRNGKRRRRRTAAKRNVVTARKDNREKRKRHPNRRRHEGDECAKRRRDALSALELHLRRQHVPDHASYGDAKRQVGGC